jgi:hypothetical protein
VPAADQPLTLAVPRVGMQLDVGAGVETLHPHDGAAQAVNHGPGAMLVPLDEEPVRSAHLGRRALASR